MSESPTISIDQNAAEVISDLASADAEQAQAVWDAEASKPEEKQRSTVLAAAEARVAELAPITASGGETLDAVPEGRAWAQLLDGDGEPVEVDGKPVETELVP